jgi:hypothetical protein
MANTRELADRWRKQSSEGHWELSYALGRSDQREVCADDLDAWLPGLLDEVRREVIEECAKHEPIVKVHNSARGKRKMRFGAAMEKMCEDCPFGTSKAQLHMRRSLRPGRFNEICQSVWQGGYFPCHKTTVFDDDGDTIYNPDERQCRGALEFVERAAENRARRASSERK